MSTRRLIVLGASTGVLLTASAYAIATLLTGALPTSSKDPLIAHQLALPPDSTFRPVLAAELAPAAIDPDACGPPVDAEFLANNQILSYYGNPYVPAMGILGEHEPEDLVARLKSHAATYDALNGPLGVRPALHFVYATAQPEPGNDGLHLLYVDRKTVREYIDLACRNQMLMFIDLQIGRSTVADEVTKALRYLEYPHVHLALDPEFTMPPGEIPGETIGTMDAAAINEAQHAVQAFVEDRGLPDKMIVVHRFTDEMITNSELIEDDERVQLVIDMDGFGPAEIKQVKFGWYAAPAEHSGIKLFFRQEPDLMSEQDVLALNPDVIIYQ